MGKILNETNQDYSDNMKKTSVLCVIFLCIMTKLTAQTLCQEQTEMNSSIGNEAIGQSVFMMDCSGYFSSLELDRRDLGAELTADLIIFNGQTSIGEPRYTKTITIPATVGPFTIDLTGGNGDLSFFTNNQYTFIIYHPDLLLGANSDADSYADGQMFLDNGFINTDDLWFRLNVSSTLAINTPTGLKQVKMYPNPAQDSIQLIGLESHQNYTIYNALGVRMMQGMAIDNQTIDVQSLSNGIYYLRLEDAQTLRFVKGY